VVDRDTSDVLKNDRKKEHEDIRHFTVANYKHDNILARVNFDLTPAPRQGMAHHRAKSSNVMSQFNHCFNNMKEI